MFGTIRKHQNWLWIVIITLTIISFVVFFSPYSKINDSPAGEFGSINGKRVTREDYMNAQREVYLQYFFRNGSWPADDARREGFDAMRESYQWLFFVRKQQEMGIVVSEEVAARTGKDMLRNFERFGLNTPKAFEENVLAKQGFTLADFGRFVKHFVGMQELIAVAGSGGQLITPQEARTLYVRENQPLSTEVVVFSASNYVAKVNITPDAVAQFYTNYLANYRIPDRVQLSYVAFPVSNYLASAESELSTNLNQIVDANFQRVGTNYGGAKTPAEAKAKIRQEILFSRAQAEARKRANEFARPLFEPEQPSVADLEKAAKAQNLKVATTAPFSREQGPAEFEAAPDFIRNAFSLSKENPLGQPFVGQNAVYVYGLVKQIPSEVPPLEQVRARVENDYKMAQAASLARQAGTEFHTAVTNGLSQGKSFDDVCKTANVKPLALPEFSLSTRSLPALDEEHVPLNLVKQLAFSTEPGKASLFQPTRDGGVLVFTKAKLPVNEEKLKTELPQFTEYVRRSRADEAFQAWFRREGEKALRNTPLAQRQEQQG